MTKELSTKNNVMVLITGEKFYLTDQGAQAVKAALISGEKFLSLDGAFIAAHQVSRIISGADFKDVERFKMGDYKCPDCKTWIPKGKTCGKCWK